MKLIFAILIIFAKSESSKIHLYNRCPFTVWPGIVGSSIPSNGGFRLVPEERRDIHVPEGWTAGKIWARRDCDQNFKCSTGSCGNKLECNGSTGEPPFTTAEFTLNGHANQDYYDVTHVNGYNLPIFIEPLPNTFTTNRENNDCKRAGGCFTDPNQSCPQELQIRFGSFVVGCKSACIGFNTDQFCCRGKFNKPETCITDDWSVNTAQIFKEGCPAAYSFTFDDETSLFVCRGTNGLKSADYVVQFC